MKQEELHHIRDIRLQAYPTILGTEDPETDTLQDLQQQWQQADQTVSHLLSLHADTPEEEGELCLTLLVVLQTGIRNHKPLDTVIRRAYDVLPRLTDQRLQCHLMVHLFVETEDETLPPDIEAILTQWTEATLTPEDRFLQQYWHTVKAYQ